MAMTGTFYLWRKYLTVPFLRYACTVEKADTEEGYRVADYDEHVADISFLHGMQDVLRAHHPIRGGGSDSQGLTWESVTYAGPEHPDHLGTAIRLVPDAVVRGIGRPA
jgi:hypothetical protein